MPSKFNPFRPDGIIAPGVFTGRIDEISAIERSLFQAKNGNPHHFLIQGERGIGKSSLFFYIEILAAGKITIPNDDRMQFLTLSVDLIGAHTQLDVVRCIGRALKRSMAERAALKEKARKVWDFLSNWEILGVRYHKDAGASEVEDARDDLVNEIADLLESTGDELDGALLLIDEADRPEEDAELGEFVKLFTERLARRGCNNVILGLAGLPSIIGKLKASHESSPRIFEIFDLQPLEPEEREMVVMRGLEEANIKNDLATSITKDALKMISELSEGYPHFVQQFSYSAFSEDRDNVIDSNDVLQGAYKENGALAQLGNKYFNEMYHARISSDDYRRVLDAMAVHGDAWVSRQQIIKESDVSETNVSNALGALKGRKIIVQDESRRGFYRLPTRSFAAWINAIRAAKQRGETLSTPLFEG